MGILQASNEKTKRVADILPQVSAKLLEAHGANLVSLILFGSAAEDRLRDTSDVNLLLILKQFEETEVEKSRETLRVAKAAINLSVMYLLESELTAASEAFAVKFQDIRRRHVVLQGKDVLGKLEVPREIVIRRLKQVLLNLVLRMRESFVFVGQREEQLHHVIADFAGPMRASASEIMLLKDKLTLDPKSALTALVQSYENPKLFHEALSNISTCREGGQLAPGKASQTILAMIALATRMHQDLGKI